MVLKFLTPNWTSRPFLTQDSLQPIFPPVLQNQDQSGGLQNEMESLLDSLAQDRVIYRTLRLVDRIWSFVNSTWANRPKA